jgi:hypothetical protein
MRVDVRRVYMDVIADLLSDIKFLDQLRPHVSTHRVTACLLLSFRCTSEVYPGSMNLRWKSLGNSTLS